MKFISLATMFSLLLSFATAQEVLPADSLLEGAYRQAAAQNKNVIVIFQASWSAWCHKMDNAINDKECRKILDKSYVIVQLDVEESKDKKDLENPGADIIKMKFLGEKAGLPFWLVLDKNGKLLADSYIRKPGVGNDRPGTNIACPSSPEEVEIFTGILKKTSSLSDAKLETIARRFKKNKQTIN